MTSSTPPDHDHDSPGLKGLDETVKATSALINTVSQLGEDDVRAPSLLPGWSRGHLITHLARNADALRNVLHGAQIGEVRSMYVSAEERDAAIEVGASRSPTELLEDLSAACHRWEHTAHEIPTGLLDALGKRVEVGPGPTFAAGKVALLRLTEVEVHHSDLGCGYDPTRWSPTLVRYLLRRRRRELDDAAVALTVIPSDADPWAVGVAGPEVGGTTADLLWWLLGRGDGAGVTCSGGQLPDIGKWA